MTLPHHTPPAGSPAQGERDAIALAGSLTTVGYAMFALLQPGPLPEAPVQVSSQAQPAAGVYTAGEAVSQGGPVDLDDAVDDGESAFAASSEPLPAAPATPARNISAREMQDLLSELSSLDDL